MAFAAVMPVSAHRVDEYLQAVRVAIEPSRIGIELDLTPGVAVAPRVLSEIDLNHDAVITDSESSAYVSLVLRDITAEVDGHPVPLVLLSHAMPSPSDIVQGVGILRLRLEGVTPALVPGTHRLVFRNRHHPEIGAYLANALAPTSWRVSIVRQDRDYAQRELAVEYDLRAGLPSAAGVAIGALMALTLAVGAAVVRRAR
jgi:hypothetical protein